MPRIKILKDTSLFVSVAQRAPFKKGDTPNIPEDEAKRAIENGVAEAIKGEAIETDEPMTLEDAIKSLNKDDKAHFTKDGKPNLNVLKELTGGKVDKAEALKIWDELNAE